MIFSIVRYTGAKVARHAVQMGAEASKTHGGQYLRVSKREDGKGNLEVTRPPAREAWVPRFGRLFDLTYCYGPRDHRYADGTVSACYQIGLYANKRILGIEDKKYLAETYASTLGVVTGYCIRFKTLKDINIDVPEAAIRFGLEAHDLESS